MDGKTSKGIVGTISFREEIKNVNFKGKTLPKETFEIFTLRLVSDIFMTIVFDKFLNPFNLKPLSVHVKQPEVSGWPQL